MICASNGKGFKWYQSDGHNPKYIPKGERALAEQLAYKKYLSLQLENARQEKKAIDAYLVQHNTKLKQISVLSQRNSRNGHKLHIIKTKRIPKI